jgi:hypothetical protein
MIGPIVLLGLGLMAAPPTPAGATSSLVAGCTGGITGGGTGVLITADGEINRWHQQTGDAKTRTLTSVGRDPVLAHRLFTRLDAIRFAAVEHNEPSNMTCFLAREGPGAHRVAWPAGQRPRRIAAVVALADDVYRAAGLPPR